MKKLIRAAILLVLSLALCASFVACGEEGVAPGSETYVFEAEYAQLPTIGAGWSGGMGGVNPDLDGDFNASNDYFVVGMYAKGSTLTFEITADKAVTDAKIVARFSTEDPAGLLNGGGENPKSYSITKDTFQIKVNGTALAYETITFNNIKTTNKFQDYTIATGVSLKEGVNVIEMVTNNEDSLGGTTKATAPLVDCIKVTTTAVLTWEPDESNLPE